MVTIGNDKNRRGGSRPPLSPLQIVWAAVVALALTGALILLSMRGDDVGIFDGATATAAVVEGSGTAAPAGKLGHSAHKVEGSKHATVMGMATGYGLGVYRSFVGSLRKSGFEGNIIIGVKSPMKDGVEPYLKSQGVVYKELTFVNCTFDPEGKRKAGASGHGAERATCAAPYDDIKLRWSRFPLLRDWLRECAECTGPVLVADFRDTFFQRDPFGTDAPEIEGLQVFQEHRTQTTRHWITRGPIKDCKGIDFGEPPRDKQPMLCSGTTVGTREAMLRYLGDMHAEMKAWMADPKCCCNKMNGDDQSIHNYLYYTGRLPYATAVPNRMGIVNTVGVQGSMILNGHVNMRMAENKDLEKGQAAGKPYLGAKGKDLWIGLEFDLTDEQGFLIDFDGGRSRVVHQWDRFGIPFNSYRFKHRGALYQLLEGEG